MATSQTVAAPAASHVDAYLCTGSSPGRVGRTRASFTASHAGPVEVDVAWEVHGPPHREAIVVLGGISADRHLAPTALDPREGWWAGVVGRGSALDPRSHRLVGFDYIALEGAPTTTDDQARALACALDTIGARTVALVGASYGGMVALSFAALFPDRVRRLVLLCAAHRSHPMATAVRAVQRRVVRLGHDAGWSRRAVSLARALAMTTYRSSEEFEERFGSAPRVVGGDARFAVEDYLDARGDDFAARFDAERFVRLSESIDLHDIDPRTVTAPTTAVSFDTDALVPPWLVDDLVARLGGTARHERAASRFGHDAFLKESRAVGSLVREALGPGDDVEGVR